MKTSKYIAVIFVAIPLILGGCMSARSPVTGSVVPNTTGLREGLVLGGSTAGGAALGYGLTKNATGAAIGGGVGLIGGAIVNNVLQEKTAQRERELIEEGRRQERVRLETEYWEAERYDKPGVTGGYADKPVQVNYSGGYFEGINLAPRRAGGDDALDEPRRP